MKAVAVDEAIKVMEPYCKDTMLPSCINSSKVQRDSLKMNVLNSNEPSQGSKLQLVNATFEIFLLYHIKKSVSKKVAMILYMCTLMQLKKDYLTIITAFY